MSGVVKVGVVNVAQSCNRHKALFVGLSSSSGNCAAKIGNSVDVIKIVTFNNTGLTSHNYLSGPLFWSFEFY